jgi:SAM-dependent methyltransferase
MRPVIQLRAKVPRADRPDGFEEDVTFSEDLVSLFVEEFTEPGELVFDPFAGFGTTLAVARSKGRRALGVELLPERVEFIRDRLQDVECVLQGDVSQLDDLNLPPLDFVITSPPYMNRVNHPQNPLTGYRTRDGNYPHYLADLGRIFGAIGDHMRPGGKVAINAANIASDPVTTLAWDIAGEVSKRLRFVREIVVDWDELPSNFTGDYFLIFETPSAGRPMLCARPVVESSVHPAP